jgi:hypothetical protein
MSVKINSLELENVKRIKAVQLEPSENGLTVIGGKNNQGKTSVLDAIAWALGGNKFRPSDPARDGSLVPPHLKVTLSNGIVVERRGKNSDLKVTDPAGNLAGQALLDSFISAFALDLPKFMNASAKEKADTLLRILGIGDQLFLLEKEEAALYNERTVVGRTADAKKKYADGLTSYDGVPEEPVSAAELIRQQQEILTRNAQRIQWKRDYDAILDEQNRVDDLIESTKQRLRELQQRAAELETAAKQAAKSPSEMQAESTAALEEQLRDVEEINRKVNENRRKLLAEDEAAAYRDQYDELTRRIEEKRRQKTDLLNGAQLPLQGLSVQDGELTFNGHKWDGMSGSEQLRVAAAIVRKLTPECGFVLLDKLEQMDTDTLRDFGVWLEGEGLQAIATRVSTGSECSVIIEDGYAKETAVPPAPAVAKFNGWGK